MVADLRVIVAEHVSVEDAVLPRPTRVGWFVPPMVLPRPVPVFVLRESFLRDVVGSVDPPGGV